MVLTRNAGVVVRELLSAFRLVVVEGARQAGKTTLVEQFAGLPPSAQLSFDDPGTLDRASTDPVGFLASLPRPASIDEYQRAGPDLLLAIKRQVDRDHSRGQLLLTGSASYRASRERTCCTRRRFRSSSSRPHWVCSRCEPGGV